MCAQDDHPDRRLVSLALDSMRSVAYLVNESKRRAEMQQFLVQWQSGVDHWMVNINTIACVDNLLALIAFCRF